MRKYVFERLVSMVFTLFIVLVLNFWLLRSMPGDIIQARVQELVVNYGYPYEQAYKIIEMQLGFDPRDSNFEQFISYLSNLFVGNLGQSMVYRIEVKEIILSSVWWSLYLGISAVVISFIIGLVVGIFCAYNRGKPIDNFITMIASILNSIPIF